MANGSILLQSNNYIPQIGAPPGADIYSRDLTLSLGKSDFTIEGWVYLLSYSADTWFYVKNTATGGIVPSFGFSNGYMQFFANLTQYGGNAQQPLVPLKTWCHIAYVRVGNVFTMYCNGVAGTPITAAIDFTDDGESRIGRGNGASNNYLPGYVSNFRMLVGQGIDYTGIIPSTPFDRISPNETIGSSSVSFGGTNTSYVEVINNAGLNLGGSQYTIELWLYPMTTGTERRVLNKNPASTFGYTLALTAADVVTFRTDNTTITSTATAPTKQWTHIAVTNDGTTTRLFVNGQLTNSVTGVTITNEAVNLRIGARLSDGTLFFNGLVSNVRIVKGSALYTSTFTPSTTRLANISGTSLLLFTNFDQGIVDESNNCNILVTDTNIQKTNFSPFTPKTRLLMLKELQVPTKPSTEGVVQQENFGSSVLFSGTATSYLEVQNNPGLNLAGSPYTIELWVYPTGNGTLERRIINKNPASTFGYMVVLSTTGVVQFRTDSTNITTGTLTAPLNTWTHIAITNDGTVTRIFVNGKVSAVATGVTISNESVNLRIGNRLFDGSQAYMGYMSNLRIIKGTALYTKTFTPQLAPATSTQQTSLLAINGTTIYQPVIVDLSSNQFTPTVAGNTVPTTFSPFTPGYYSNFFDGSGDYLTVTNSAQLQLAGSAYTIELWVYPTGGSGNQRKILNKNQASTFGYSLEIAATTNIVQFFTDNTNLNQGTLTAPLNSWTHIAVTNDSTTTRLFVNGQLSASATGVTITNESANLRIGARLSDGLNAFTGNISNVRIVKGTALYTSTFTPSTAPLTVVTNTSLLACYSANAFVDVSTFAHTITATGNVTVSSLEPFDLPVNLTNIGSTTFDGTGDYVNFADNTLLDMEAQDFTIETWVYPENTGNLLGIFSKRATTATFAGVEVYISNLVPSLLVTVNGTSWAINSASTVALNLNRWNHLALVRSGTTWNLFVNGQLGYTGTLAGTVPNNTAAFTIGARAADGSNGFWGRLSNFRIVKGTALYTQAFTPQYTTPLTTVTNTSLLTLTTSGINLDATNKNYIYSYSTTTDVSVYPWKAATYEIPEQFNISLKDYSVFNRQDIFGTNNIVVGSKSPFDNQTLQNLDQDTNSIADVNTFASINSVTVAKYLTITTSDALNDPGVISPEQTVQTIYNSV